MGIRSKIEWCTSTYNPWQGCHKVSAGCKNCYMFRQKKQYGQDPNTVIRSSDKTFHAPLKWEKPQLIFTCSWSDFFIEEADIWRDDAWGVIRQTPRHTYQILTKRPERIREKTFPENVWIGVSIENEDSSWRFGELLAKPAIQKTRRFISYEPLLGPILGLGRHNLSCVHWVIVGGESGPNARPMAPNWVRQIRDDCLEAEVPFFFKQWGGNKKIDGVWGGRELDGRTWDEIPGRQEK